MFVFLLFIRNVSRSNSGQVIGQRNLAQTDPTSRSWIIIKKVQTPDKQRAKKKKSLKVLLHVKGHWLKENVFICATDQNWFNTFPLSNLFFCECKKPSVATLYGIWREFWQAPTLFLKCTGWRNGKKARSEINVWDGCGILRLMLSIQMCLQNEFNFSSKLPSYGCRWLEKLQNDRIWQDNTKRYCFKVNPSELRLMILINPSRNVNISSKNWGCLEV